MRLIIDISEEYYNALKGIKLDDLMGEVHKAIKNGVPVERVIEEIEEFKEKDKLCKYPYSRCINVIKELRK